MTKLSPIVAPAAIIIGLFCAAVRGQKPDQASSFEVASIRPTRGGVPKSDRSGMRLIRNTSHRIVDLMKLKCPRCKHVWNYNGNRERVTGCSNCHIGVTIRNTSNKVSYREHFAKSNSIMLSCSAV
jgi:ssDNA-binding Zn-finger/Zn-ribbon topoisomerase 1